ncbi:MAG: 2OG-Fe(II) oxygenase [Acetobacteraceae bacterium]|nr:2OG-Fe(II) oxygenase [Acetobacteraceae bacterium]
MRSVLPGVLGRFRRRPEMVFAPGGLERLAGHEGYALAEPFPHLTLDGLFDDTLLRAVVAEFPNPDTGAVESHNDGVYVRLKHNTTWQTRSGPTTARLLAELSGPRVLLALERATGISGLMPDPYLFGGGLHFTGAGGKLAVHADFNRHPKLLLDRRLNLLLYLNEGWSERNQGWLELWDREMRIRVTRIAPLFNRAVIFSTTSFSFHGQPEPILGPPGLMRRSVALYYYTNGRPPDEVSEPDHSTLWRARPGEGF